MDDRTKRQTTRRAVLGTIGASTAALSLSTPATARNGTDLRAHLSDVREEWDSPTKVQAFVNEHQGLLRALTRDGHLRSPQVTVPDLQSSCEYIGSSEGARVWGLQHPKAAPTAHITIRRSIPAGRLVISASPTVSNRVNAVVTPTTVDGPIRVTRYTTPGPDAAVERSRPSLVPERPGDLTDSDTGTLDETGGVSPSGTVLYLCINKGDYNDDCGSYECYSWQGECLGDNDCEVYDCTGDVCCGGCCCCEDVDYCCEVCGDYDCESGDVCDDPAMHVDCPVGSTCCDCC